MDSEGKFWCSTWGLLGCVLIIVILLTQSCYYKELAHEKVLIEAGVSYMEIQCHSQYESEEAACIAWALGAPYE